MKARFFTCIALLFLSAQAVWPAFLTDAVFDQEVDQFTINGRDLGPDGSVSLLVNGAMTALETISWNEGTGQIVAGFANPEDQPAPGTYRLAIFPDNAALAFLDVTLGAVGPAGPAGGGTPAVFTGFTAGGTDGGAGVLGLNNACNTEFPGSRMCTSAEFFLSATSASQVPQALAWVQPVISSSDHELVSGLPAAPFNMTCNGWSQNQSSFTGLTVGTVTGSFNLTTCQTIASIACCSQP